MGNNIQHGYIGNQNLGVRFFEFQKGRLGLILDPSSGRSLETYTSTGRVFTADGPPIDVLSSSRKGEHPYDIYREGRRALQQLNISMEPDPTHNQALVDIIIAVETALSMDQDQIQNAVLDRQSFAVLDSVSEVRGYQRRIRVARAGEPFDKEARDGIFHESDLGMSPTEVPLCGIQAATVFYPTLETLVPNAPRYVKAEMPEVVHIGGLVVDIEGAIKVVKVESGILSSVCGLGGMLEALVGCFGTLGMPDIGEEKRRVLLGPWDGRMLVVNLAEGN